jgi:hypothetical protein
MFYEDEWAIIGRLRRVGGGPAETTGFVRTLSEAAGNEKRRTHTFD